MIVNDISIIQHMPAYEVIGRTVNQGENTIQIKVQN